jgi:transketolase
MVTANSFDRTAAIDRCVAYRRRILDISQRVSALHIAPAYSCMEMVDAIYHGLMARGKSGRFSDTFIMSKGHGYLAQAVILEDMGILPASELDSYCKPDGRLGAHPDFGIPGIEAATGSLGHGFGIGVGMAAADKILGDQRRVFVIIGDGEAQEGSVWEAIMLDFNDYQGLGRTSESHPFFYPIAEKLSSFGWETADIDGHNSGLIVDTVLNRTGDQPLFVCCRTIKGQGVSFMQNDPIWHYRSPNKDEYVQAIKELEDGRSGK